MLFVTRGQKQDSNAPGEAGHLDRYANNRA